jgi:arylsulfatase/arylsulfatase A
MRKPGHRSVLGRDAARRLPLLQVATLHSVLPVKVVFASTLCLGGLLSANVSPAAASTRPNVILIMTDDQGYGDFGAMGNTVIETPQIDAMAARSVLWENFYVSPVCSPTRASLMTGRYHHRTYCVDTWLGRSMMATEEVTIAEILHAAGYATGIFGKWHLGDNYPMRPMDQGFEEALVIRGGGLAQPADPIDNHERYTNPILMHNGREVSTQGYCTDVYFDHARRWIEERRRDNRPFFAYIAPNAPHGPFHDVPEDLRKYYLTKDLASLIRGDVNDVAREVDTLSRIAAMISNIDANVGRLFHTLRETGVYENTLVMLLTDNGPNTGRYVRQLQGRKTQVLDGGIRTPLWSHWPARLKGGQTVKTTLAAHIDILPTLAEACGATLPRNLTLDGRSLLPQLIEPENPLPQRPLFIQTHRGNQPQRYHNFMVRDGDWKLIHPSGFTHQSFEGEPVLQLYDLGNDPGEQNDLAGMRPRQVDRLKSLYDAWYEDVMSNILSNPPPPFIIIDPAHENPVVLTWQDRIADQWNAGSVGFWKLKFARPGRFDIQVDMPGEFGPRGNWKLVLTVGSDTYEQPVSPGSPSALYSAIEVTEGPTRLRADLVLPDGSMEGGFQVRITCR